MVRVVAAAIAIGIAAAVGIVARQWIAASQAIHRDRKDVTPDDRRDAERRLGAIEDVALVTSDGLTLRGWYAPSKNGAAVVFVHAGSSNRTNYIVEAGALARAGFGVLVYDSRAAGESEGDLVSWGDREQRDLAAAFDFVQKRADVDQDRLGLAGASIGATTVALFAAADPRPRAVLLYATWTSLEDEIRFKFGQRLALLAVPVTWRFRSAGIDVNALRPVDRIADISPRPLLVVTGDADEDTPLPVMRQLFARANEPKTLLVLEGAGHGGYAEIGGDPYLRRVVDFFRHALTDRR